MQMIEGKLIIYQFLFERKINNKPTCVYVCAYICVCEHACIYVCVCTCVCIYVCIYVYICVCVYIYMYIYIYVHICIHTHIYTCIQTYRQTYTYSHIEWLEQSANKQALSIAHVCTYMNTFQALTDTPHSCLLRAHLLY